MSTTVDIMRFYYPLEVLSRYRDPQLQAGENYWRMFNLRTLMSTTVDILRFYWQLYNQLLKVKCAFNFATLIYVGN